MVSSMTTYPTTQHLGECDHCDSPATMDFGRPVQVPGLTGKTQRVCCHHARGLRGHRGCTLCAPAPAPRPFNGSVLDQLARDVAMNDAYWSLPGHGATR